MYVKLVQLFFLTSAFSRITMSTTNVDKFPTTLAGFGYGFNEEGKVRKIDKETGKFTDDGFDFNVSDDPAYNQKNYEALGEVITEEVYKLLEEKIGLHKIYIPQDAEKDQATFIFSTQKELKDPKKLLILIHGSGVVRAGQWSRSLIINHSLDSGTQIPYVEKAKNLGYEVILMNTNDNYRTINGKRKIIAGNGSPTQHAATVWDKFVKASNPESVSIVAHSYGGVVTLDLAKKYSEFFQKKVFAVGLTDSVHSTSGLPKDIANILKQNSRNWVTSQSPLDTEVRTSENDIPRFSAGHVKHEWTSYSCIDALFKFFEEKYENFEDEIKSKKSKLDL